jgi:DNA-binding NarL/FixJ family response regulator
MAGRRPAHRGGRAIAAVGLRLPSVGARPDAFGQFPDQNLNKEATMTFPIFLVEDDPQLRDAIGEAINAVCDAEIVATADTETQAVSWLNGHPRQWKLAVVDLFLKVGTGFGVLERLAPRAARAPVIVLTNSATPENRDRCLALGALAVYDKTEELDRFLDHCLRHRQRAHST